MKHIRLKKEDHIGQIFLNRGSSNAMDMELVNELTTLIKELKEDPSVEGITFFGKEGFFSSGLDLITLYDYDKDQMHSLWKSFLNLILELLKFEKPAVAGITGHSPAGGCVLALCCDYRVMVEGDFIIGLNEVPVGIIVPHAIFELYSFWIGRSKAYQYLLSGTLLSPQEALKDGLIHEIVAPNRIGTTSINQAVKLTQFEKNAWRSTKQNLRAPLVEAFEKDKDEVVDQILKQWWSPSTRNILKTLIENLSHKK